MKRFFLHAYKLMFLFIPIPLFFDFGSMQFLLVDIKDYSPLHQPQIPMPIGGIALFIAVLIGYLCSVFYKRIFYSVFSPVKLLLFYSFVVVPISAYAVFVSGLSLPRLVQLLLPMAFVSLLSFPVLIKDRIDIFRNVFLSGFLFFNFHFFSVVFTSKNLLSVSDREEFSGFFGKLIYQSLVSYPAVLSLYLFLTIALIYVARKEILPRLKRYKLVYYYFLLILLYLLAASGRRAFLVEYVAAFFIIIGFALYAVLMNRFVKKKTIWYISIFFVLFVSFFAFYINTPLSDRVLYSIEENTFDSGRVDILNSAFSYFSSNLSIFFFGGGPLDVPGFHNFILDQIYRVGLIGMLSVYVTMIFLVRRFVKINDQGTNYPYHRRMFVFVLIGSLFLQSMINASVSQPYYFINFLMVATFVYFVLFPKKSGVHKSQFETSGVL